MKIEDQKKSAPRLWLDHRSGAPEEKQLGSIPEIVWQAPEYQFREKGNDWYWALGILTVGLFATSIVLHNFLFAIIIAIGGFAVAIYSSKRPDLVKFAVSHRGVKVKDILYPYDNLKSFWIEYDPPYRKELIIESKKVMMPYIVIQLGGADPIRVRENLLKFLREMRHEESLITTLARVLKF